MIDLLNPHRLKFFIANLFLLLAFSANADYLERPEVAEFIDEMVASDGFDAQWLQSILAEAQYSQSVIDAISRPAERTLTWAEYQKIFLTESRVDQGIAFWRENEQVLIEAEAEFGVPAQVILSIIGVETLYGRITGSYRVIDALATLAFDYPPRAEFFRGELESLIRLANKYDVDATSLTGSYAGAMGLGQFIPSSYLAYSADYDGDGFSDLWQNSADAIWSVANYLSVHGWVRDQGIFQPVSVPENFDQDLLNQDLRPYVSGENLVSLGVIGVPENAEARDHTLMHLTGLGGDEYWLGQHNFYVITRYNHSRLYAMAVTQLAHRLDLASSL